MKITYQDALDLQAVRGTLLAMRSLLTSDEAKKYLDKNAQMLDEISREIIDSIYEEKEK